MLKRVETKALDIGDAVVIFQVEDSDLHDGAGIPFVEGYPELTEAIVQYCRGNFEESVMSVLREHAIEKVSP